MYHYRKLSFNWVECKNLRKIHGNTCLYSLNYSISVTNLYKVYKVNVIWTYRILCQKFELQIEFCHEFNLTWVREWNELM